MRSTAWRATLPTLASTPRVTDDARRQRVQAIAPYEPVGLGIACYLLSSKVAGQVRLVARRFGDRGNRPGQQAGAKRRDFLWLLPLRRHHGQ